MVYMKDIRFGCIHILDVQKVEWERASHKQGKPLLTEHSFAFFTQKRDINKQIYVILRQCTITWRIYDLDKHILDIHKVERWREIHKQGEPLLTEQCSVSTNNLCLCAATKTKTKNVMSFSQVCRGWATWLLIDTGDSFACSAAMQCNGWVLKRQCLSLSLS